MAARSATGIRESARDRPKETQGSNRNNRAPHNRAIRRRRSRSLSRETLTLLVGQQQNGQCDVGRPCDPPRQGSCLYGVNPAERFTNPDVSSVVGYAICSPRFNADIARAIVGVDRTDDRLRRAHGVGASVSEATIEPPQAVAGGPPSLLRSCGGQPSREGWLANRSPLACRRAKVGPTRIRTWNQPIMSRRL